MSNVLQRFRSISGMEFYRNITELRDDMTKFLLREKNVPRRYRAVAAYPLIDAMERLIRSIERANRVQIRKDDPELEENIRKRRALQRGCLDQLDEVYYQLQRTVGLLWKDKLRAEKPSADTVRLRNTLNDFAARLRTEEKLLEGWREGSRKTKSKPKRKEKG